MYHLISHLIDKVNLHNYFKFHVCPVSVLASNSIFHTYSFLYISSSKCLIRPLLQLKWPGIPSFMLSGSINLEKEGKGITIEKEMRLIRRMSLFIDTYALTEWTFSWFTWYGWYMDHRQIVASLTIYSYNQMKRYGH